MIFIITSENMSFHSQKNSLMKLKFALRVKLIFKVELH